MDQLARAFNTACHLTGRKGLVMWQIIDEGAFDPLVTGFRRRHVMLGESPNPPRLSMISAGNGKGPTVLVTGGTHGDEFEGQIAALELARSLDALTVLGRLIVLPFHHEAACRAGTRLSPVDGRDLNRAYGLVPSIDTGPTLMIARFVEGRLLPHVDLVIDLHSGGETHEFVLSSNLQAAIGGEEHLAMRPLLMAFDAPYAITFDEAGENAMPHAGTLEGAARALGKQAISSEIGGGGHLTAQSVTVARQGLINLLHHVGVVRSAVATPWHESRSVELSLSRPDEHLTVPVAGWFCPSTSLGDRVMVGDSVGTLTSDLSPFDAPMPITARTAGIVAALPTRTRQKAGAAVAYVAAEL
jgi:predicted deacylase